MVYLSLNRNGPLHILYSLESGMGFVKLVLHVKLY